MSTDAMAAVWRALTGSNSMQSPKIADNDHTYPLHMLDDTKTLRGIIITWTLRFNDVLDADMLHGSLSRLLEIGDWRKLGGRLRLNNEGALEIIVPSTFTAQQPALSYTHQTISSNIDEHELAKQLPKTSDGPSLHPGPDLFRSFAAREDAPSKLEHFLNQDIPQLSLHVTSFHDATLVALSWPHTLMDVMGQQALVRAWSLVLAGKESEVPPLLGAHEDAIGAAADALTDKAEVFNLTNLRIKGMAMVKFGLRFAWDMLWKDSLETRTIFLPTSTMTALRKEAEADLNGHDEKTGKPFVSDGDILTAWMVRMVASSLPRPRPITVLHALNARFRLKSLINAPGVYVQNMVVAAFAFLSFEVATGSLGKSALQNRSDLTEQASESQVLAFIREIRQEGKSGGDPASFLYGDSNALLVPFTNWTRANLFATVDFSPAVIRTGESDKSRNNPAGTMIFHHATSMQSSPSIGNVIVVLGKDHCGNYWLTATLMPKSWSAIEDDLRRLH